MTPLLLTFLIILVVGGGLAAFAFVPKESEVQKQAPAQAQQPGQFFVLNRPSEQTDELADELLFARLEQYVRQERAAVEHFHDAPRAEDLRARAPARLH